MPIYTVEEKGVSQMRVAHNIQSLNTLNRQKLNRKTKTSAMEKLSSGLRINKAADDAAGLSISQKMRAQIRGLNQASRNAQDGISLIQTAEGALGSMTDITQRMRELCVQGANGTLTDDDRDMIQLELDELKSEMGRIASDTEFNTKKLLDGSLSAIVSEEIVETSTTTQDTTIDEITITLHTLPGITIPNDGTVVSTSVNVNGELIEFQLKDDLSGGIEVDARHSGISIGNDVYVKSIVPEIEWEVSLGGSNDEVAYDIQQTVDGGFIIAGYSNSNDGDVTGNNGSKDYWIAKLDSNGNLDWQKSLGSSGDDEAYSIHQTSDGGYIVGGHNGLDANDGDVTNNNGSYDFWITKLDSSGNLEWQESLGGSIYDVAYSVQQTSDGGYIIGGDSTSSDGDVSGTNNGGGGDYWIVKLDSIGSIEWEHNYGSTQWDWVTSIQQTSDGGYIAVGKVQEGDGDVTTFNGSEDAWVIKMDSNGDIVWEKSLGGTGADYANSVQQTNDGGYIVAALAGSNDGDITGNNGNDDAWIVKLDSTGNIEWQNSLGGSLWDYANDIQQTSDGGYIVAASTTSYDGDVTKNNSNIDYWAVKLDPSGDIEWEQSLGSNGWDYARSVVQANDGGYVFAGDVSTSSGDVSSSHGGKEAWIVKLASESSGNKTFTMALSDVNIGDDRIEFDTVQLTYDDNTLSTLERIDITGTYYDQKTTTETTTTYETVSTISGDVLGLQIGANVGQRMSVSIDDMHPEALGFTAELPSVKPRENAELSLTLSDRAIQMINSQRSYLGAAQNRLEHVISNVNNTSENLQAAESRIADSDMAEEMMELTKANILDQVTNAMLTQSNQLPNMVLELLK